MPALSGQDALFTPWMKLSGFEALADSFKNGTRDIQDWGSFDSESNRQFVQNNQTYPIWRTRKLDGEYRLCKKFTCPTVLKDTAVTEGSDGVLYKNGYGVWYNDKGVYLSKSPSRDIMYFSDRSDGSFEDNVFYQAFGNDKWLFAERPDIIALLRPDYSVLTYIGDVMHGTKKTAPFIDSPWYSNAASFNPQRNEKPFDVRKK
jgi:hypothetical protein